MVSFVLIVGMRLVLVLTLRDWFDVCRPVRAVVSFSRARRPGLQYPQFCVSPRHTVLVDVQIQHSRRLDSRTRHITT